MKKNVSRGIRNKNPGNIRKSKEKWQGLSSKQDDKSFFVFDNPIYGIRAIARILITYQDKYNLRTVDKIINRWAPPSENNTKSYVNHVLSITGFEKKQELDMHSFYDLKPMVEAIIMHENGNNPYTDAQITKALVLAGVEPDDNGLSASRTVKAGRIAAATTVLTPITDNLDALSPAIPMLKTIAEYAPWALAVIALSAIGYIIYARMDDKNKGLR